MLLSPLGGWVGGGRRAAGGLSSLGKPQPPSPPPQQRKEPQRKRERGEMPFGGGGGGGGRSQQRRRKEEREKWGEGGGGIFGHTGREKKRGGGRKKRQGRRAVKGSERKVSFFTFLSSVLLISRSIFSSKSSLPHSRIAPNARAAVICSWANPIHIHFQIDGSLLPSTLPTFLHPPPPLPSPPFVPHLPGVGKVYSPPPPPPSSIASHLAAGQGGGDADARNGRGKSKPRK